MSQTKNQAIAVWLAECFTYDDASGVLYWKERPTRHFKNVRALNTFNAKYPGKKAGRLDANGYCTVKVSGKRYMIHRVVWALFAGSYPENGLEIDHVDRNRSNNRFYNLRLATRHQNSCNQKPRIDNTTGFKGVGRQNGRWRATTIHKGRFIHLGVFDSPELAHEFYCLASDMLRGAFSSHG